MNTAGPLFDREQLQENHKGVEDLIPSTIGDFLTYIPDMMSKLQTAYDDKKNEELIRAAHSLKGSVASVCSESLRELAYKIEILSRDQQTDDVQTLITQLEAGLAQLKIDLEKYQQELSQDG